VQLQATRFLQAENKKIEQMVNHARWPGFFPFVKRWGTDAGSCCEATSDAVPCR
jgi:hypothetical protein